MRLLSLDASHGLVEILLIEFKADEVPTLLDASDGGRAAAHTVVEHRVALVGVGENEIAQQVNGLLGGVPSVGVTIELNDVDRMIMFSVVDSLEWLVGFCVG